MIRRFAVSAAVLPLLAGTLLLIGPTAASASAPSISAQAAQGDPVLGKRCRKAGKKVLTVRDIRESIKIAYGRSFVLEPGGTLERVRKVRKDQTVSSDERITGGVSGGIKGLAKKLVGSIEAELHVAVVNFDTTYTSRTTTVHKRAHNPTKRNRQFVAYKGTHNYKGKFRLYHCSQHPVMRHPEWTLRSYGVWRTHRPLEEGTIRCGAGYPSAVSKVAAARHCG
jgi:SpoU rRNA methylase family enzyme